MTRKYKRSGIGPEEFVRIWQSAKSLDEVVEKTGMGKRVATTRASYYRRQGVPLKKFRKLRVDWEALAKLAEETEK